MFDGEVYLAKADTGHYKIGVSKTPGKRIKHFRTIMPVDVEIVHRFASDNCREAERLLHEQFASLRHRGEWFNLQEHDVQHIVGISTYFEGEFCFFLDELNTVMHRLFAAGEIVRTEAELPY